MLGQILTADENFLALRRIGRIEKNSSIRECEGKGIIQVAFLKEYLDTGRIKQIVLKKKFQEFAIGFIGQKITVSGNTQSLVSKNSCRKRRAFLEIFDQRQGSIR